MINVPETISPQTFTSAGAQFDNIYFDRIILDDGTDEHSFFTIGHGQNFPAPNQTRKKNKSDTNFAGKGVESNKSFWIFGFMLKYYATQLRTVAQNLLIDDFLRNTFWQFILNGDKAYGEGNLDYIMGEPRQVQMSVPATENVTLSNVGITKGYLPLNKPIPLAKLTDFQIDLKLYGGSNVALNDDELHLGLVGIQNKKAV